MSVAVVPPASARMRWPILLGVGAVIAVALVGIGDQYPFSSFPMYSNVEPSADVLLVTDQNDQPLAISSLFDVGSAQGKKRFEKELLAEAKTRDYENAKPEQVSKAAEKFLQNLWKDRKEKKTAALNLTALKARIITISLDENDHFKREAHALGQIAVVPSAPAPTPTAP